MSSSSAAPKFRVAICGAGIGGLALAIAIGKFAQHDVQIDVYESRDAITTAGAGILIGPRAAEIVQELGMYEEAFGVSTKPPYSGLGLPKSLSSAVFNLIHTFRATIKEV
ncbi:hypothetical protein K503DRAFT_866798 [Rhizopogon vinicolor AM-OR11-026]|uniref:FAD-binding domain-containing protein n=1 Tax=Rhizopogon vinicolor AM-OR11-026 TaxID=1314800 RepID=A0A1B7MY38_9AGAM|nr:hypothetical protein K503DRAFT_866798 [Rhizopogon vinicolor AM-OR11-026]